MNILLDDEEIKNGKGEEYDRRYPLTRGPLADLDCYNAVAKAQLRKIVEIILKDTVDGEFSISEELYVALLKECE